MILNVMLCLEDAREHRRTWGILTSVDLGKWLFFTGNDDDGKACRIRDFSLFRHSDKIILKRFHLKFICRYDDTYVLKNNQKFIRPMEMQFGALPTEMTTEMNGCDEENRTVYVGFLSIM